VKVWVENTLAGMHRLVASAYLTFVAVDAQGRRVPVPQLLLETEDEKRRFQDAGHRRELRQRELARKKASKTAEVDGQSATLPVKG
jgi:acyl-CoA hydrolase